ncbi:MAG: hypothetical protein E7620_07745 [Ruminococcaceae bacterium]|nr:hypothetical protein [Oscillospiraceae bacterium]
MRVTKNNGWKVASNIVGYGGVVLCCVAALVYVILHLNGIEMEFIGPYKVENLYYIGGVAVAFIVIGIVLRLIGNAVAKKALDVEINEAVEEIVEEVVEDLGDEIEVEEVVEEPVVEEVEEVDPMCQKCAAVRAKLTMTPETKEKVVATVKKSIPVIVAVVATAAVTTALNRAANEKKKAKARKTLLDFFY